MNYRGALILGSALIAAAAVVGFLSAKVTRYTAPDGMSGETKIQIEGLAFVLGLVAVIMGIFAISSAILNRPKPQPQP